MSVDSAAGTPQLKDVGLIPTLYADDVNVEYNESGLMPNISTTKYYTKLLEKGDKVEIAQLPSFTHHTYKKNQELVVDTPEGSVITMSVDRAEYFSVLVDKIDSKQSHLSIVDKYKKQLLAEREGIETRQMFADIYTQAHSANQGATAGASSGAYNLGAAGSPVAVTSSNIVSVLTQLRSVLAEQNADNGEMWMCIPAWMRYLVINSSIMKVNETGMPGKSGLVSGYLTDMDGMKIYSTNTLKTSAVDQSTGTYVLGGNMDAISSIRQINEVRILDKDGRFFGRLLQGLSVYDWKVRKPEGLGVLYAYKG